VTVKRPWPDGERSPWTGGDNPPSIFEVARLYPSRALGHAFFAAILGLFLGAFLAWGSFKLLHAYLPVPDPTAAWFVMPFCVVAFVGLWCEGMYQDVRGRLISTWGD
jgi:hypothetical protein